MGREMSLNDASASDVSTGDRDVRVHPFGDACVDRSHVRQRGDRGLKRLHAAIQRRQLHVDRRFDADVVHTSIIGYVKEPRTKRVFANGQIWEGEAPAEP